MRTVVLVGCVKTKAAEPCKAADLYTSTWFKLARAYAQRLAPLSWYILSAEHGLVGPQTVIAPYEKTLNKMRRAEQKTWAASVRRQLATVHADRFVILAGVPYRRDLVPFLERRGSIVEVPMRGLTMGRQLSWMQNSLN